MAAATTETMHMGKTGARPRANLTQPQNPKVQTAIPEQPVTMERSPYNPLSEPKALVNPGELAFTHFFSDATSSADTIMLILICRADRTVA